MRCVLLGDDEYDSHLLDLQMPNNENTHCTLSHLVDFEMPNNEKNHYRAASQSNRTAGVPVTVLVNKVILNLPLSKSISTVQQSLTGRRLSLIELQVSLFWTHSPRGG